MAALWQRAGAKVQATIDAVGSAEDPEAGLGFKQLVSAAAANAEHIDRTGVDRNAKGCEEPHSADPSLWRIGEAEVDLTLGHPYEFGGQLWYLASRAHEKIAKNLAIPGQPLNRKARNSKVKWIPEKPVMPGDEGE